MGKLPVTFLVLLLLVSSFGFVFVPHIVADSDNWWNTDFAYRKRISFNNSAIVEDLINFTVPINFTSSQTDFWGHIQANGNDTRFVDADNQSELYYEFEYFNSTSDDMLVWVRVPLISANVSTDYVYLYYGNSTCDFDSYKTTSGAWTSDYCGVWHLNSLTGIDSAGLSANTTATGSPTVAASAKFSNSIDMGTTANVYCINLGADADIDFSNDNTFTVEFWVYFDVTSVDQMVFHQSQGSSSWNVAFGTYDTDEINNRMKFITRDDDGTGRDTLSAVVGFTGWVYVAGTYNNGASDLKVLYVNGTLANSTATGVNNLRAGPATASQVGYGGDYGPMDGRVDEFRLSTSVRSAAWILACYQYENDQSMFTFAAEDAYASEGQDLTFETYQTVNAHDSGFKNAELEFMAADTLSLFGNGLLGKACVFLAEEFTNLFSSSYSSVELEFVSGHSLGVFGSHFFTGPSGVPSALFELWGRGNGVMSKELGFLHWPTLWLLDWGYGGGARGYEFIVKPLLTLFAGNDLLKELSFSSSSAINVFEGAGVGRGFGFVSSQLLLLFEDSLFGKELGLTVPQNLNLLASLSNLNAFSFMSDGLLQFSISTGLGKGAGFVSSQVLNVLAANGYGKSLSFSASGLVVVYDAASMGKSVVATLSEFLLGDLARIFDSMIPVRQHVIGPEASVGVSVALAAAFAVIVAVVAGLLGMGLSKTGFFRNKNSYMS